MQKTFLTTLIFTLFSLFSIGQNCTMYFPMYKGAKLVYNNYNPKGKKISEAVRKLKSIHFEEEQVVLIVVTTVSNAKGKVAYNNTVEMICKEGSFFVSMRDYLDQELKEIIGNSSVRYSDAWMELPAEVSVGDKFPDSKVEINITESKGSVKYWVQIKGRRIVKKETITTPAGEFECFKMSYILSTSTYDIFRLRVTEWYTEDFGLIKSEYRSMEGNFMGTTVLESIH